MKYALEISICICKHHWEQSQNLYVSGSSLEMDGFSSEELELWDKFKILQNLMLGLFLRLLLFKSCNNSNH